MDNHERHDKRLDSLEASMKMVEAQVDQIAEQLQGHQKGKLPSQLEQAMAIIIIIHQQSQSGKEIEIENGVEEIPEDDMPLHDETKGEDMEMQKEENVAALESSEIDQRRDPLSFPSLHKANNPYRPPIPLECHPKKADNDKKLLKIKDPESFMVNIFIGVKRQQ